MKKPQSLFPMAVCLLCAAIMIIDSRACARSAQGALDLCIRTLIPGLFPLFVLSAWLVPRLGGFSVPGLASCLGLPEGSDGIFLLGLVGGFPTGGVCISQAVRAGALEPEDAARMMGFCNNCGPAFLFGVLGSQFPHPGWVCLLFLIQLETALIIGMLWPGKSHGKYRHNTPPISLPAAVRSACGSMANVCAWVILASVAAGFLQRWLFPMLPSTASVVLCGLMELSGGCLSLTQIPDVQLRFLLAAGFVCFGGCSVLLQIQGQAAEARIPMLPCVVQKCIQGVLGAVITFLMLRFGPAALLIPIIPALILKKAVEIPGSVVYNSPGKGGI